MYALIKTIIKRLIPKKFLFENELILRKPYGLFYKGKKYQCNICKSNLKSFITLSNKELLCPFCGSLPRNRRLWHLLNEGQNLRGYVLHFSPNRCLYRILKKNKNISYYSTDFTDAFLSDYKFDITNIEQLDEKFDTIICYHILEHIIDDKKAISELFRVLKPDGQLFIQTPFKEGSIYEDYSITSAKEREKHFGQHDHVRVYSIQGLKERLESEKFKIEIKSFENGNDYFYFGLNSHETILIATK